jgi:hypothetical protein
MLDERNFTFVLSHLSKSPQSRNREPGWAQGPAARARALRAAGPRAPAAKGAWKGAGPAGIGRRGGRGRGRVARPARRVSSQTIPETSARSQPAAAGTLRRPRPAGGWGLGVWAGNEQRSDGCSATDSCLP